MDSRLIEQSIQSKKKVKARRKNRLVIIFILIGLFATLTLTVLNEPLWAFGLAGGLILIVVLLYAKEILQSLKNRN